MASLTEFKLDNRLRRGEETRHLLMQAAEKLVADKGVEQLSIRDILSEARQNNSSALQYHFGSLKGLMVAIHEERSEQTRAKRAELLDQLLAANPNPDLRQICTLMIRPAFDLARAQPAYRRYLKAFAHQLTLIEDSAVKIVAKQGGGGESGIKLGKLLRRALPHLSQDALQQRMDFAVRLCASALHVQAGVTNAFRGEQSDSFIEGLTDALMGLLSAPESSRTN